MSVTRLRRRSLRPGSLPLAASIPPASQGALVSSSIRRRPSPNSRTRGPSAPRLPARGPPATSSGSSWFRRPLSPDSRPGRPGIDMAPVSRSETRPGVPCPWRPTRSGIPREATLKLDPRATDREHRNNGTQPAPRGTDTSGAQSAARLTGVTDGRRLQRTSDARIPPAPSLRHPEGPTSPQMACPMGYFRLTWEPRGFRARTRVSALRVVATWSVAARTYGAVATGGCHGVFTSVDTQNRP